MNIKPQWLLIESEQEYDKATARYEEVKRAPKGSEEHQEKLLLVQLISEYEKKEWDIPEVNPVELIRIRTEDL